MALEAVALCLRLGKLPVCLLGRSLGLLGAQLGVGGAHLGVARLVDRGLRVVVEGQGGVSKPLGWLGIQHPQLHSTV